MGTPDFAVKTLDTLVKNNYRVVGVITAPDKPAGRGQKIHQSAVKKYAVENNLTVLQPEKLKDEKFLNELKALKADLQVVVAFRMLPEVVWNMPPKGTFNLHASLLPQYRGAAPINWAIINGEKETGVTTFFIEKEIDTGNIIFQEKVAITTDETAGTLHDKLMNAGAELVLKTVQEIEKGTVNTVKQEQLFNDENQLKAAPKIFKEDGEVDWSQSAKDIYNKIRGLSPYPCAWTKIYKEGEETTIKLYDVSFIDKLSDNLTIDSDNKSFIHISLPTGTIAIDELQLAGKKRMDVKSFLAGNDINSFKLSHK